MTQTSFGRYEIKQELGRGGMAAVYHAFDPHFRREVAIKVLPREFMHDALFHARFEREAQTIASLEHPAIVPVYDFGEEDGQPYLVMRYMQGGSLADGLAEGPVSIDEAARILGQLAPGLDQAHAHGVVHRDLKPGNILFDQFNNAYLSDFGIAKLVEATATLTGGIVGTPGYMSPEQVHGDAEPAGSSDLYSLGVILFQLLTGQLPYNASTPSKLMMKHVLDPVPSILSVRPDLPPGIEAVITRALAKDPADRFATAHEMVEAYETAIHGEVTGAPPPGDVDAPVETSEQTIVESADPATPADTMPDAAPAAPWQQPAPRKFLPQAPTRSIPRRAWIIVWAWIIGGIAVLLMLGILVARQILNLGIPAPTVEVTEEATGTPDAATGPPSAPAPTLTAGEQEKQVAEAGVTRNDDWTPYIEEFNGVPMALIPAGCFQMGSTSGDLDEQPVHEVCFEEPFWIDVYEITNEQHGGENPECTAVSSGSSQPLICTNWIIAQAYCNNRDARLPTEAEWEYAARGPDGPVFPWGNTFVGNHAIFSRNSELRAWDVGSRPNGVSWVGAFDLSGNVTEWVSDWYGEYERGTQVNPQGASNSEYRVLRGGAWNSEPYALRSTDRSWSLPFDDHGTVGFRCAQDY